MQITNVFPACFSFLPGICRLLMLLFRALLRSGSSWVSAIGILQVLVAQCSVSLPFGDAQYLLRGLFSL